MGLVDQPPQSICCHLHYNENNACYSRLTRLYQGGMYKLPHAKRVLILNLLVEGSSMRSISRVADVSINTVAKILVDAGEACDAFHNETVRGVRSKRVQCDEIWAFCYAKQKNVAAAKDAPEGAGDLWTWTAIDAD